MNFKTSDSTWVTGKIISVTDSSFSVSTYEQYSTPDTVEIKIRSVKQVTNELMNDNRLTETAGWLIVSSGLFALLIPIAWIDDGPQAALDVLQGCGIILGFSGILLSPYLIQRNFKTKTKWALVLK